MIEPFGASSEISVEVDIDILDYSVSYKFIPTIFSIKLISSSYPWFHNSLLKFKDKPSTILESEKLVFQPKPKLLLYELGQAV